MPPVYSKKYGLVNVPEGATEEQIVAAFVAAERARPKPPPDSPPPAPPREEPGLFLQGLQNVGGFMHGPIVGLMKGISEIPEGVGGVTDSDTLKDVGRWMRENEVSKYISQVPDWQKQADGTPNLGRQGGELLGGLGTMLIPYAGQIGRGAQVASLAARVLPRLGSLGLSAAQLAAEVSQDVDRQRAAGMQIAPEAAQQAAIQSTKYALPDLVNVGRFTRLIPGLGRKVGAHTIEHMATRGILPKAAEVAITGGFEGFTEGLQKWGVNTAIQENYNPNQDPFEQVGVNVGLGMGIGGLLETIVQIKGTKVARGSYANVNRAKGANSPQVPEDPNQPSVAVENVKGEMRNRYVPQAKPPAAPVFNPNAPLSQGNTRGIEALRSQPRPPEPLPPVLSGYAPPMGPVEWAQAAPPIELPPISAKPISPLDAIIGRGMLPRRTTAQRVPPPPVLSGYAPPMGPVEWDFDAKTLRRTDSAPPIELPPISAKPISPLDAIIARGMLPRRTTAQRNALTPEPVVDATPAVTPYSEPVAPVVPVAPVAPAGFVDGIDGYRSIDKYKPSRMDIPEPSSKTWDIGNTVVFKGSPFHTHNDFIAWGNPPGNWGADVGIFGNKKPFDVAPFLASADGPPIEPSGVLSNMRGKVPEVIVFSNGAAIAAPYFDHINSINPNLNWKMSEDGKQVKAFANNEQIVAAVKPIQLGRQKRGQPVVPPLPPVPYSAPVSDTPVAPVKSPQPYPIGKEGKAKVARGYLVPYYWTVVPIESTRISNDDSGGINPDYPGELQPRERTRISSEAQINGIISTFDNEQVADNYLAGEGAPFLGDDMATESGNGRLAAIRRMYALGMPQGKGYRSWQIKNAERWGVTPDYVSGIPHPALVRVRMGELPEGVTRAQFARDANEDTKAQMSSGEQAMVDAKYMTPELIASFRPGEDGEIVHAGNNDFIRRFVDGIVPEGQRGAMRLPGGEISKSGIDRVRNAVFALAYNDKGIVERLAEDPEDNIRNIVKGLTIAAPKMIWMRSGISNGDFYDFDISPDLASAASRLSHLRENRIRLVDHLNQEALIPRDPMEDALLSVFNQYGRSSVNIAEVLNNYTAAVQEVGNPKQEAMFGRAPIPTKLELLGAIVEGKVARDAAIKEDKQQRQAAKDANAAGGLDAAIGPGGPGASQVGSQEDAGAAKPQYSIAPTTPGETIASLKGQLDDSPLLKKIYAAIKRFGIEDLVSTRLVDNVRNPDGTLRTGTPGSYLEKIITLAMADPDAMESTLNHEMVHAIKEIGMLTDAEWTMLTTGLNPNAILDDNQRDEYTKLYRGNKDMIHEEAIAIGIQKYMRGDIDLPPEIRSIVGQKLGFLENLGRIFRGEGHTTPETVMQSIADGTIGRRQPQGRRDYANQPKPDVQTGSTTASGAPVTPKPKGAANIGDWVKANAPKEEEVDPKYSYVGSKAYSQDEQEALQRASSKDVAIQMDAAGKSAKETRLATGWFKSPYDKVWKQEITDHTSKLTEEFANLPESEIFGKQNEMRLDHVLDHPELFRAYPELRDVKVIKQAGLFDIWGRLQGSFNPKTNTLNIAPTAKDPGSVALHEVQHWIQEKEGFATGGNEDIAMNALTPERMKKIAGEVLVKQTAELEVHVEKLAASKKALAVANQYRTEIDELRKLEDTETSAWRKFKESNAEEDKAAFTALYNKSTNSRWDLARTIAGTTSDPRRFTSTEEDVFLREVERANSDDIEHAEKQLVDRQKEIAAIRSGDPATLKKIIKSRGGAFAAYQSIAGEIEARDVEARQAYTPEERGATDPMSSEAFDSDDVITVFGKNRSDSVERNSKPPVQPSPVDAPADPPLAIDRFHDAYKKLAEFDGQVVTAAAIQKEMGITDRAEFIRMLDELDRSNGIAADGSTLSLPASTGTKSATRGGASPVYQSGDTSFYGIKFRKPADAHLNEPRYSIDKSPDDKGLHAKIFGIDKKPPLLQRIKDFVQKPDRALKVRQALLNQNESVDRLSAKSEFHADPDTSSSNAIADIKRAKQIAEQILLTGKGLIYGEKGHEVFRAVANSRLSPFGKDGWYTGVIDKGKKKAFEITVTGHRMEILAGRADYTPHPDADAIIAEAKDLYANDADIREAVDRQSEFNDTMVDMALRGGVIDEATAKKFKDSRHVAFYRKTEDDYNGISGGNSGGSIGGRQSFKAIKGGKAEINDSIDNLVRNTHMIVDMAMKNVGKQKIARDAVNADAATVVPRAIAGETVPVRFDGKEYHFKITDKLLYESLNVAALPQGLMMDIGRRGGNLLRTAVTHTPVYLLNNAMRDSLHVWSQGYTTIPYLNIFTDYRKVKKGNAAYDDMIAHGTIGEGILGSGGDKEVDLHIKDMIGQGTSLHKAKRWMEERVAKSETLSRVTVYESVIKKGGTPAEARQQARELLNFDRRGANVGVRILGALVPFQNAGWQGTDVLWRNATGSAAGDSARMARTMIARMAYLSAASALYTAVASTLDAWKKATKEERDQNWFIPIGNGNAFRVPIPFELGTITKIIPERTMAWMMGHDEDKEFAGALGRAVQKTLQISLTPQVIRPGLEAVANYDFYRGKAIENLADMRVERGYRAGDYTSELARIIGETTTLSPIKIDHMLKGYFGSSAVFATQFVDIAIRAIRDKVGPDIRLDDPTTLPLLGRMFQPKLGGKDIAAFYEMREAAEQAYATLMQHQKTGTALSDSERTRLGKAAGIERSTTGADQQMAALLRVRKHIQASKQMTSEQRYDALRANKISQDSLATQVLEAVKRAR